MKKLVLVATMLAFAGAQIQTAKAHEDGWATAGKILTGVAIGAAIASAVDAHASYAVTYSGGPAYCAPPRVVCAPPVVCVPPRVIVAPAPVVCAPRPVVMYRPPVVYAPVVQVRYDHYASRGHGRYDRHDRHYHDDHGGHR